LSREGNCPLPKLIPVPCGPYVEIVAPAFSTVTCAPVPCAARGRSSWPKLTRSSFIRVPESTDDICSRAVPLHTSAMV
jgi:hypothetical protein